jgi:hypothetical protein
MSNDQAVYEKYIKHVRGYFAAVGFLYAGALLLYALSGDPIPKYLLLNGLVLYVVVAVANHFNTKYKAKKNAST